SDGWSVGVLTRELGRLYEAYSAGRPSPLGGMEAQYGDYAQWQRSWMEGERLEEQLEYWRAEVRDGEPLGVATGRRRGRVVTGAGASETQELPVGELETLKELSRREGVTLYMTLLCGFTVLLSRYTQQDDVTIGTPIANRNREEIEGLIGCFVNTLVL